MAQSIASTGTFTAPQSGSVLVTAYFVASVGTNGDQVAFGLCSRGGGYSAVVGYITESNLGSGLFPYYSIPFLLTTLSGSYDLDLCWAVLSGQTASMYCFGQTAASPALGSTSVGGPVVMTVEAV